MFDGLISFGLWLLVRYYFHLYRRPQFDYSEFGCKPATPAQLILCRRHLILRKYHIRKIHGIKDDRKIDEFYYNCGCKYCVRPIYMQGFG